MMPLDRVLDKLGTYTSHGRSYRAACPGHGGNNPTALSITEGEDGVVWLHCFVGCDVERIVGALGLELKDLFPPDHPRRYTVRPTDRRTGYTPTPKASKLTQSEKVTLALATREIAGLCLGPIPSNPADPEALAPWSAVVEILWDVYADQGTHEAVQEAYISLRPDLAMAAPKLLREVDRRLASLQGKPLAPEGDHGNGEPEVSLRPYSIADLMRKQFPHRQWAVEPFFPEGLTVLAGPPGIGKSYFALNLGLAVSMGGKAFGELPVQRGAVLYLSLEDDEQAMQERIDTVWEHDNEAFPDNLYVQHEGVPQLGSGLIGTLEAWLQGHTDARLIVIDILADIKPPRGASGDWYLEDKSLLTPLRSLAHKYHVAIILLHHTNRRQTPESPFDMIHGGAGIEGTPDVKAVLLRGVGQSDAVLAIRGRGVMEQRAAFAFSNGVWKYLGQAEDFQRTTERQEILTYLRLTPEAVGPKHVATMLGREEGNTRKLMSTMARQGELQKVGYGLYTTPRVESSHIGNTDDCDHTDHTGNTDVKSKCYEADLAEKPPPPHG